ncbi:isoaspartyl dipeptidase-like protein [Colletotrichum somersetense]|nr:isoaspartyl dipeptidase-like protein [Colletotrichum somersetense]
MAPARDTGSWVNDPDTTPTTYKGFSRNIKSIDNLQWSDSLADNDYSIFGTHPDSKILFLDVNILDSTGVEPYHGDVYIEGERISAVGSVPDVEILRNDPKVRVFHGRGRTLMSGLGDSHTHFTWNGSDLDRLGELEVEEHTLLTMRSAKCSLDSGYTMCFGAASAKERLDVVIRNAINAGDIPGPRYLANGKEMARRGGELVGGITAFADGPEEMRRVIKRHVELGVDNVKLSISGEEITEIRSAQDCYFTDEEMAACVDEAHKHGKMLCAHARARDSVTMCIRHGVEAIFHASYIDEQGMDMLEEAKGRHVVVPAINWLIATLNEAGAFGYTHEKAKRAGYARELRAATAGLREMHRRGIVVLPGGDYGFAWTPHGTYARDLEHFVNLLGFTPHEAIIAATAGVAKLLRRPRELGCIQPGYFADCILVDGNPLDDIRILQDHSRLNIICINGRVHKAGRKEYIPSPIAGQNGNKHVIAPDMDFPEVKTAMQKQY